VSVETQMPVTNGLISGLPRKTRERVLRHADPVDLEPGNVLCEQGQPYRDTYFPLTGFISLVVPVNGHRPLEIGLIGNEGMLGATLVLGLGSAPQRAVVQGSGTAWRVGAAQLRRDMRDSGALRDTLARYVYVLMAQSAQSTACARFHEVEARLARCLLMTHDRAPTDYFHLTHQMLADMLGVQRSAVTIAAGGLQGSGLIRYSRGRIDILSRSGLEEVACECHAAGVKTYERYFS
jgi:CRP-like cAMP-binding protein